MIARARHHGGRGQPGRPALLIPAAESQAGRPARPSLAAIRERPRAISTAPP